VISSSLVSPVALSSSVRAITPGAWRLLLVLLVCLGCASTRVDAGRYAGEITGSADGGMPEFFYYWTLGETWTLNYSYESDSIDGVFSPASGNLTLTPGSANIGLTEASAFNFPFGPMLQVNGSTVSGFSLLTDPGTWYITETWWNFDGFGGGRVTITAPQLVPDSPATAGLLLFALAACAVARRASVRESAKKPSG
jgi:hypothetical protein